MKIYNAAICEDDLKILRIIHKELQKEFQKQDFPIQFEIFSSAVKLLNAVYDSINYDLLFLDIDMPDINGIELCRRIRKIAPEMIVVFISNKEELVFQSIEVQPFRFVRKKHFSEELPGLVRDIIHKFNENKNLSITLTELHSQKVFSIDLSKVFYIEALSKYCCFVTANGTFKIQYRIKHLEMTLASYGFLKTHRSYLVNYRYIFSIQKESLILENQLEIPLSRSHVKQVKENFLLLNNGEYL